jgi:hypothetical protein
MSSESENQRTTVTVYNQREPDRGERHVVALQLDAGGPQALVLRGHTFRATGTRGSRFSRLSKTREMVNGQGARLWISQDGAEIWED